MCQNCKPKYGFDLNYGCSANMAEASERYLKLKKEILKRAASPSTDVHIQFMLREIVAEVDNE